MPRNGREYDFKKVVKRGSDDNDGSLDSYMRVRLINRDGNDRTN